MQDKRDINKAIIYCRVSTKDQADKGYSLEDQEEECKKFALSKGLVVDKIFIERGESAKTQDRHELQKLIKYAIENKNQLSHLIIWKLSRFVRNVDDQLELTRCFKLIGIKVLFVLENNEESPTGNLMRIIVGAFNQYENEIKGLLTSTGMKRATKEGRWCWKAPIGYNNARDAEGRGILVPSAEAVFISEAFQMAETGLHTQVEIANTLRAKGFKDATPNLINRILRNSIYTGLIKVGWFPDHIEAIHERLVSRETFQAVQLILDGKRPSLTPKRQNHPDFPLRNFVRCPTCGEKLTGGWSSGRNKKKYAYYHCRTKGCSCNTKKDIIEGKFIDLLRSLQPKADILPLFRVIVLEVLKDLQRDKLEQRKGLERELHILQDRQVKLDNDFTKGSISAPNYERMSAQVTSQIDQARAGIEDTTIELEDDMEECLKYCEGVLPNIASLWQDADLDLKQRFQILLFPAKIFFDGEKFGNTGTALIVNHLQQNQLSKSNLVGGLAPN